MVWRGVVAKTRSEWTNAEWCDKGEVTKDPWHGESDDDGDDDEDDDDDWDGSKEPTYVNAWSRTGGCWKAELLKRDKGKKECLVKWCGFQAGPEIVPDSWVTEWKASESEPAAIEDRPAKVRKTG